MVKYTKIIVFVLCGHDQVNKTCNLNESLGYHVKSSLHQRLPLKKKQNLEASTNILQGEFLIYNLFAPNITKLS